MNFNHDLKFGCNATSKQRDMAHNMRIHQKSSVKIFRRNRSHFTPLWAYIYSPTLFHFTSQSTYLIHVWNQRAVHLRFKEDIIKWGVSVCNRDRPFLKISEQPTLAWRARLLWNKSLPACQYSLLGHRYTFSDRFVHVWRGSVKHILGITFQLTSMLDACSGAISKHIPSFSYL